MREHSRIAKKKHAKKLLKLTYILKERIQLLRKSKIKLRSRVKFSEFTSKVESVHLTGKCLHI